MTTEEDLGPIVDIRVWHDQEQAGLKIDKILIQETTTSTRYNILTIHVICIQLSKLQRELGNIVFSPKKRVYEIEGCGLASSINGSMTTTVILGF